MCLEHLRFDADNFIYKKKIAWIAYVNKIDGLFSPPIKQYNLNL